MGWPRDARPGRGRCDHRDQSARGDARRTDAGVGVGVGMTMTEGMVRPDALSLRDGRPMVAVHLPWYRSLPIACLDSVDVTVDGQSASVCDLRIPGFAGPVHEAWLSDAVWD